MWCSGYAHMQHHETGGASQVMLIVHVVATPVHVTATKVKCLPDEKGEAIATLDDVLLGWRVDAGVF